MKSYIFNEEDKPEVIKTIKNLDPDKKWYIQIREYASLEEEDEPGERARP